MTLTLEAIPVPLRVEPDGGIRVGDTRVHLEILIAEHKKGSSPEEIARGFDTLRLADIYAVITYYLGHTDAVEAYIAERERKAEQWRQKLEAEGMSRPGLFQELLARRARMESGSASPADR
jgi:uncharacterized protein (DUF433 family)